MSILQAMPPRHALRIARPFPLDSAHVWRVLQATSRYRGSCFPVHDVAAAFGDCAPDALFDVLWGLERAGKLAFEDRPARILQKVGRLDILRVAPPQDDDGPMGLDAYLDKADRERILDALTVRDASWTMATLGDLRIRLLAPADAAASDLGIIDVGVVTRLVEEDCTKARYRRGLALPRLMTLLGLDESHASALEEVLEAAVAGGDLEVRKQGNVARWSVPWEDTRRGRSRILDLLRWSTLAPAAMTRSELAEAANVWESAMTQPVDELLKAGLLVEEGARVSAAPALARVLSVLARNQGEAAQGATARRLVQTLRDAFAASDGPERASPVDKETAWVLLDDLVSAWLESPVGPYRGDSRPSPRVPLTTTLRLTPEAWARLGRCAACREPWGTERLRMARLRGATGWKEQGPIVHERCALLDVASDHATRALHARCSVCKDPYPLAGPGPIFFRDLQPGDAESYVEGWGEVKRRLARLLHAAEADAARPLIAQRCASLRARMAEAEAVDLAAEDAEDVVLQRMSALAQLLPRHTGWSSPGSPAPRGKSFTFHATRLRQAVREVEATRRLEHRLVWTGKAFAHPACVQR